MSDLLKNKQKISFSIVVPTRNAGLGWADWISALSVTGVSVNDVYVIDSSSTDNTFSQSVNQGFNVEQIALGMFNHGATRQYVVNNLSGYEFVIFLTQDAILTASDSIERILLPFEDDLVSAVCGRQLPRENSSAIEAHARIYNYSARSRIRTIEDKKMLGLKTAFLSNSFAAYRISAFNEVGGFPETVIFGEDMFVAAKMLLAGYKIAYAADACVYHSHDYSLVQEMRRYFDMGFFHASEPWIRQELGGAEGEGLKFVISEQRYLLKHAFWRMPEGVLRTVLRYAGFRLGLIGDRLPLWFKSNLAMNKGYFKG